MRGDRDDLDLLVRTEPERSRPSAPRRDASTERAIIGSVIGGKYELQEIIGEGGMGIVFAARHDPLGHRVAIKFLRGESARDPRAVRRFFREARAAIALSSEHVVRVLDAGGVPDAPYIVMEYLRGVDLARLLERDGPLPIGLAVDLMMQACEAVAEAHASGIVHRDLKPSNLFMTSRADGSPLLKVLDFGISKAAPDPSRSRDDTANGVILGSPRYMSPEQVTNPHAVDARSDVWSLGIILYEVLAGVSPFDGDTADDIFLRVTSEPLLSLRERRPDVPRRLAEAIEACLERRIDARIQTVGDLASKLSAFATSDAAQAGAQRISRVERVRRATAGPRPRADASPAVPADGTRGRRERRRIAAAAGAAVLLLALGGAMQRTSPRATPPPLTPEARPEPADFHRTPDPLVRPPSATALDVPGAPGDDDLVPWQEANPPTPSGAPPAFKPPRGPRRALHPARASAGPSDAGGAAAPATVCSPNFYLDEQGDKHFRPECFLGR